MDVNFTLVKIIIFMYNELNFKLTLIGPILWQLQ